MDRKQVLKQRTQTGIIFAAVVLFLLLSGKYTTIALFLLIAGLGTHEYIRMIFPKNVNKLNIGLGATFLSIISCFMIDFESAMFMSLTVISCIGMGLGIIHLFKPFIKHRKSYVLVSIIYLGLPIGLMSSYYYQTEVNSTYFFILIISLIWASDSFAYLVGSRVGKRKLFERISPKKTWEGFIGGGFFTLVLGYIYSIFFTEYSISFWVLASLSAWIIGTLGDLVESSIKRNHDIKDSGSLLPGHGGILDRFDSFIYILPFILLLLLIL